MPDKPLTVFTYAASASLAAVAVVYFFHPSYLFDSDAASSTSSKKKSIVGLHNPANDCFINCVLQSIAGLGDLRVFLIREIHRRDLVDASIYENVSVRDRNGKVVNAQKLRSLQQGEVTKGMKEMIDRLNERPMHRKTITAGPFIRVLERAFGSTISKAQQDAQEFLQLVAERLCEEYHAGVKARARYAELTEGHDVPAQNEEKATQDEDGFPLEGKTETKVECEHCHFIPKAKPTSFVMLNLMVPQQPSSTLNDCFDAHFKREFIEDYKCDKCRLTHALELYNRQLPKVTSESERSGLKTLIERTERAIEFNPEKPPEDLALPDIKLAPKRKISRHVEITVFPKILVVHLSRSIYDRYSYSMKNSARVTFPERFPVGGIINRRTYRLSGLITHKGTHNSGHYETFRRQHTYAPYSNPHEDQNTGPYSAHTSPMPTPKPSPAIHATTGSAQKQQSDSGDAKEDDESTSISQARTSGTHSLPSTEPSSIPEDKEERDANDVSYTSQDKPLVDQYLSPPLTGHSHLRSMSTVEPPSPRLRKKKKTADRWWRISDDKVKECKTTEVLGMTREVDMLFYEME